MPSPLGLDLGAFTTGAIPAAPVPAAAQSAMGPLNMDLTGTGPGAIVPSAGQLARTAWNQGGQTLQIQPGAMLGIPGTLNTHIPLPQWLEHRLIFQGRGVHDVGQGIKNAGRWIGDKFTGRPYQAPAQTGADRIMAAAERQHPAYNYLAKWPAEFAASLPLGESAGALAGRGVEALGLTAPETAPLWQRALSAIPQSSAVGAAYGAQQRQGSPGVNAAIGAVAGPLLETGMRGAGAIAGKGADAAGALWRGITRSVPEQAELDSRVGNYLRSVGAPASVAARATPEGVAFPTAVHANDPALLDLQGKERAGQRAIPFHELATQNDVAIVNGVRQNLAPQPDSHTVSSTAHDLLQGAQATGKATVKAAYQPFDEAKGGVYLEREPIQKALRDAHQRLLPSHQEMLPAKVREVMEADHPLHLMSDVEDLGARLSDAIGAAPRGTPAVRALMMMRDALNKGVEDAPLANQADAAAEHAADATELWKNAKAANKAFRDRFPQGTARDSESRSWLSKWLSGRKDPGRFLTEATVLPSRAKAVLDAMQDDPQAQEQMRQMMRNHYVNRLLLNTRASVPGERLLNPDALTRARGASAAVERVLLRPNEADLLDRYVGAARDNAKILQRSINGSSETASLLQHQASKGDELLGSGIVHAAAKVHPVAGALAHMLLPRGAGEAAAEALQGTLTNALLDPAVYNRVMSAEKPESVFLKLLKAGKMGAIAAVPRATAFTLPQQLGPALAGTR